MKQFIVEQRMTGTKWEYRNAYENINEALSFLVDHPSGSYPYRIRLVTSQIIFIEGKHITKPKRKNAKSKRSKTLAPVQKRKSNKKSS